jgi:hypothetical protein
LEDLETEVKGLKEEDKGNNESIESLETGQITRQI